MGYFRINGTGTQASEPIERIAPTALDAEFQRNVIQRLCGRFGKVEVYGRNGRGISPDRLRRLAQEEESAKAQRA